MGSGIPAEVGDEFRIRQGLFQLQEQLRGVGVGIRSDDKKLVAFAFVGIPANRAAGKSCIVEYMIPDHLNRLLIGGKQQ